MTHETVDVSVRYAMRSRREFLKLSGITALGIGGLMFLTGCGPAPLRAMWMIPTGIRRVRGSWATA